MSKTTLPVITSDDVTELGAKPNTLPTDVIIWRVDITVQSKLIDIGFNGVATYDLANAHPPEPIESYLSKLVTGDEPRKWYKPDENKPGKTTLSIAHKDFSYIVFVLDEKNWQFSKNKAPFRVQTGKQGYYRFPQCAWLGPDKKTVFVTPTPPDGASCKVASFIANSTADQIDWGGFTGSFETGFNFYLDVVLTRGAEPQRLLPIIVDPDVGYPGGSHP